MQSTSGPRNRAAALVQVVARAKERDFLGFMLALAVVQGAPALSQLVAARLLGPHEFGVVRLVEAALGILLIPAGVGMSSAVVRYTAAAAGDDAKRRVLALSLRVTLLGGVAVSVVTMVGARHLPLDPVAMRYLATLVSLVLFTNASRTVLNYFQGRKEFGRAARWSVITAGLGTASVITGTALAGLGGWALARGVGEVASAVVLLFLVRSALPLVSMDAAAAMLRFGGFMAASLVLDRVATTADVLILDGLIGSPRLVGQYGAAALVVTAASLLPAAAVAMLLPRLSERARNPREALTFAQSLFRPFVVLVVLTGGVLALLGPPALTMALGDDYRPSGILLVGLTPSFVLSALLSYGGAILLAFERADLALVQSGAGAFLGVILNLAFIPTLGAWGPVLALSASSLLRTALMALFVFMILRAKDVRQAARS